MSETGPWTALPPRRAGRSSTMTSRGWPLSGFAGAGFQEVAEDGFVGVEADAGVLQVDDDGVEVFQVVGLGPVGRSLSDRRG